MPIDEPSVPNSQSNSEKTSRTLIDQLKQNHSDAWQRLYQLYEPLVRFWCRRVLVPEQEMSDLVQDVFQTVAKNIGSFSINRPTDNFRGWLKTITHSRIIDWRRRNTGKPQATGGSTAQLFMAGQPFSHDLSQQSDDDSIVEEALTQQLYGRALKIIRQHFKERTWKAFWRVVVDGMTPKEVGRELSMNPSTVRVAKSRVLHRLRAELGEWNDDPQHE